MLNAIQLTWWELFGVLGLSHALYLIVYMVLRSGRIARASVALVYFSVLSCAFLVDFGMRYIGDAWQYYAIMQDMLWLSGPFFSYLLIVQAIDIDRLPHRHHYLALVGVLAVFMTGSILYYALAQCWFDAQCYRPHYQMAFSLAGVGFGSLSMLAVWFKRDALAVLANDIKMHGGERYWLVIAMIVVNTGFLAALLVLASGRLSYEEFMTIRNILGLGLVYLASTSLFRIYPQSVRVVPKVGGSDALSAEDQKLIPAIEDLLQIQKVYHEASYGRADMARELNVAEATISRIINLHYGKSLPQILNEKRVDDACRLLIDTDESIAVVAEQVGFNSLASFNRAFRDIIGKTPSEYKKQTKESSSGK